MTDDIDELRRQHEKGSRISAAAENTDQNELRDAIAEAIEEMEAGKRPTNLSIRDERLAAIVAGLEATGEAPAVANSFRTELGRDQEDDASRSELLALALRFAFQKVEPDTIEAAKDAYRARLNDQF